ncbi:sigma 54-interacting transcriptional regulator [Enterococcus casseliflavus]|uniref:sigma 54-interacting transcriptional regulator n=1 Tax=Enterococcus casseliflavus TaxID=37734 RepID=UPI003D0DCBA8
MSKEKVQAELQRNTQLLEKVQMIEALTTEEISEAVTIRRNTTSQYLNELVKEDLAIKVKTRPAVFYDKAIFSEKFFCPSQSIYDNLEQLIQDGRKSKVENDDAVFQSLIGAQSSLRMAIDQIKASVYYPGIGLPMMFHGETGVGKSMLVAKTYEYCISQGLIAKDAPFLELNCAQYYHNQELLSSILFGYKKGAFTGANEDHIGLLEASNGGILFLDECHRLSPESQEKLFTFMDIHRFSRIGENNKSRESKVRLIFATTEDISKSFLRTFTRRVPVTINVPSLQERTSQEISEYIYTFFIRESCKLDREIVISPWIMNRLISLNYRDNVGELKNLIKIICASAYSKQTKKERLEINSSALENSLMSKFLSLNEIDNIEIKDVVVTPNSQVADYMHTENEDSLMIRGIFKVFEGIFQQYREQVVDSEYVVKQLAREVSTVVETMVYDTTEEGHTLKLLRNTIKELVNFLETSFFVNISGNSIVALTSYLYKRNSFSADLTNFEAGMLAEIQDFISVNLLTEKKILNALLELVESKLDVIVHESEKILLAFYLRGLDLEVRKPEIRSVILAHGFSTASSIADVVNRFMEEHLFDSFDMPFNVKLDKVEEYMHHYIRSNDCSKGLVLLADMGSLMVLTDTLVDELTGPILMINNVTTQQALFVAEMIKKGMDLEIIGERLRDSIKTDFRLIYPKLKKTPLIITVCHTGLGAAQQLKDFLDSSLPKELEYSVEAVDFHYLKKYGKDNSLFKQYDVQGIVGTADPEIEDISFVSLEDLITGQGHENINALFRGVENQEVRKAINNNLVRNLSIERLLSAITILDVKRVIAYIDESISEMERSLKFELTNSKKAILYVHIASLVERMIRNHEIGEYRGKADSNRSKKLMVIANSLETLENAYAIKISDYELNYLFDIIYDVLSN